MASREQNNQIMASAATGGAIGIGYVITSEVDSQKSWSKPYNNLTDWYVTLGTVASLGLSFLPGVKVKASTKAFDSFLPLVIFTLYKAAKAAIKGNLTLGLTGQSNVVYSGSAGGYPPSYGGNQSTVISGQSINAGNTGWSPYLIPGVDGYIQFQR